MAKSKEITTRNLFYELNLWDVPMRDSPVLRDTGSRNIEIIEHEGAVSFLEQRIPPALNVVRDVNDSIAKTVLIEHETVHGYGSTSQFSAAFDGIKYLDEVSTFQNLANRLILKVPSRVFLTNEETFHISVRTGRSRQQETENLVLKLLSRNFRFSESMVQLSDSDTEIQLKKSDSFRDFTLTVRIYLNNEIVHEREIYLFERK